MSASIPRELPAAIALLFAIPLPAAATEATEEVLRLEHAIDIAAPPEKVWVALATPEGLRWIAPDSNVEMEIGGDYELFFFPDHPEDRGMEGTHVLAFLPGRMLVTEGELAGSWVVWELASRGEGTRLTVSSAGSGPEWAERAPYFDKAMPGVLRRLAEHVEGSAE